ncbi:Appr-1-p processing protein [Kolteria novifilia]
MTHGRACLIGLMRRYLSAVMDPWISLLEIHKLMYFMQESGEPLRLNYSKGHYGPYSKNLRHVLNRIEGHFISGYGDAEDDPTRQIQLLDNAVAHAEQSLSRHEESQRRFDRVVHLIEGFESSYGIEVLSSVHWVQSREGVSSPDDAIASVHGWNKRKQAFSADHIRQAWQVLDERGWLKTPR